MLVKEFLFSNSKFSAFNNNHFVILCTVAGLLVTYHSLYYAGRFYAANYEAISNYIPQGDPDIEDCITGWVVPCLIMGIGYTGYLIFIFVVAFLMVVTVLLYKSALYIFCGYFFYVAAPSIRSQYSRFCDETATKVKFENV